MGAWEGGPCASGSSGSGHGGSRLDRLEGVAPSLPSAGGGASKFLCNHTPHKLGGQLSAAKLPPRILPAGHAVHDSVPIHRHLLPRTVCQLPPPTRLAHAPRACVTFTKQHSVLSRTVASGLVGQAVPPAPRFREKPGPPPWPLHRRRRPCGSLGTGGQRAGSHGQGGAGGGWSFVEGGREGAGELAIPGGRAPHGTPTSHLGQMTGLSDRSEKGAPQGGSGRACCPGPGTKGPGRRPRQHKADGGLRVAHLAHSHVADGQRPVRSPRWSASASAAEVSEARSGAEHAKPSDWKRERRRA